jgi:hypothetical protein
MRACWCPASLPCAPASSTSNWWRNLAPAFGAGAIRLYRGTLPDSGVAAYVIDAPDLYDRPGNPYADANNHAYPDNYQRFALLGWIAARLAEGLDPSWQPQVVHAHDWHAGLAPAYLKAAEQATGRAWPAACRPSTTWPTRAISRPRVRGTGLACAFLQTSTASSSTASAPS